ncbi:MAG: PaaI family thioesterase [Alphaproteobacteria bacterium]|nr:PaaI family thioesterase [Alphaproteobacteria bacterium]
MAEPRTDATLMEHIEAPSGFRQLVGFKLDSWCCDEAVVSIVVGPRHLNRSGNVHGGVLTTLIDAAGSFAGCFTPICGNVRKATTLSMAVEFHAPMTTGRIVARGRVTRTEGPVFHAAVEIATAAGAALATGQVRYRYQPGSETPDGVPLPRGPERRGTTLG